MIEQMKAIAVPYLARKAEWSQANDAMATFFGRAKRAPLRKFTHPREIWAFFAASGAPYTGDPLGGLGDFYLHPTRLQYALERRAFDVSIDCDDVALWAVACWRLSGGSAYLYTILDERLTGTHVMAAGGTTPDGRAWIIDTNGYHERDHWPEADVLAHWSEIYKAQGYVYKAVIESPIPFGY